MFLKTKTIYGINIGGFKQRKLFHSSVLYNRVEDLEDDILLNFYRIIKISHHYIKFIKVNKVI